MEPDKPNYQPAATPQIPQPVASPPVAEPMQSDPRTSFQPNAAPDNVQAPQTIIPQLVAPATPPQEYIPQPQQPSPQVSPTTFAQPQAQPVPQAFPVPSQTPFMPANPSSVQDGMRSTIIKIIGSLTALSLAAVLLVFFVSGATDSALNETSSASNAQADYQVPTSWSTDNRGSFNAYYNQATLEGSQATLLVINPVRVSFDSQRISDAEIQNLVEDYRRNVNDAEGELKLSDASVVEIEGFYVAYDFQVSGLADDGITEISGLSRILFDDKNYAHTLEFVAIGSYWDTNEAEVRKLLESYKLKAAE